MSDIIFDLLEILLEVVVEVASNKKQATSHHGAIKNSAQRNAAFGTQIVPKTDAVMIDNNQYQESKTNYNTDFLPSNKPVRDVYTDILHKAELQIMTLIYMLQQDDGKITFDEARILKKHIRTHKIKLLKSDIKRFQNYANKDITIETIITFIHDQSIPVESIKDLLVLLKDVNNVTKRHSRIIEFVQGQIYMEVDFL
ncbi:hypothetical protein [Candidatus Xianfuyuplasma coldseepsis]|uniref:Uncharacterized protein n=1 Tax=Candidatus Xianfuyuplasma coldseepsis TaxID=2782163 RepID=A0A7L7KTW9_9MOLU|nr:hypothetical protein [Xianfuyuplasma coldseepsis]QMS85752.1 hypothetical protein G4Z02_08345 [Xianfuyuplasma coldseepsis]